MYGGRGEVNTEFWCRNLMGRDHMEDLGVDGMVILKCIFKMWNGEEWTGLSWLRIRTGGGLL
jgi:hypothetical protein